MEYASRGDLYDYLSGRQRLSEREARRFFRQIVSAVRHCHQHLASLTNRSNQFLSKQRDKEQTFKVLSALRGLALDLPTQENMQ